MSPASWHEGFKPFALALCSLSLQLPSCPAVLGTHKRTLWHITALSTLGGYDHAHLAGEQVAGGLGRAAGSGLMVMTDFGRMLYTLQASFLMLMSLVFAPI